MVQAHATAMVDVIRHLSAERNPACLVDPGGNYLFVNEAWERKLREEPSSAPVGGLVGTSWLDHFRGEELRRIHAEFLFRALRPREGARPRPVTHVVEDNTPTTAVLVQIRMAPVWADGGPVAVAITHTSVRERPIAEVYDPVDRRAEEYRGPSGTIAQCACCRRVRDPQDPERWDLVQELVEHADSSTEQVLCDLCRDLHFNQPVPE